MPDVSGGSRIDQDIAALTHLDGSGRARMVDVTGKPWTRRRALARCTVAVDLDPEGLDPPDTSPTSSAWAWKRVLDTARIAGIQAAKRTSDLIPLCHPLTVTNVEVRLTTTTDGVEVEGEAETVGPTGVEMEALTACAFAALSVASALEESGTRYTVEDLALWQKSGGRSGTWNRR